MYQPARQHIGDNKQRGNNSGMPAESACYTKIAMNDYRALEMKDEAYWRDVERYVRRSAKLTANGLKPTDEDEALHNKLYAAGMCHSDWVRIHNRLMDTDLEYRRDSIATDEKLEEEILKNPPISF